MLAAFINEIYFDPPGSSGDTVFEYVELRGDSSGSLDDHYLIILENEGPPLGTPGDVEMIFDLNGLAFGSNGFLTMRQKNPSPNQYTVDPNSTNLVNSGSGSGWGSGVTSSLPVVDDGDDGKMENSGGTFMLIHVDPMTGTAPSLTQVIGTDVDGSPIMPTGWTIVDAIGVHSEFGEAAGGRLFAQVNFGPEPATNLPAGAEYIVTSYEIEYIGRWGDSTGQTAADWHASNLTDNVLSGHTGMGDFRQSGAPHGLSVVDRHIFYNQSKFDNNTAGVDLADSSAIATDKSAYLPGAGLIGPESITSYTRGINGVMIDFGEIPGQIVETSQNVAYGVNLTGSLGTTNYDDALTLPPRAITASDFIFRMSEQGGSANNSPSTWVSAPAPSSVSVLADTPVVGNFRVELIWANNTIVNRYLEVIVKGGDVTGGFNITPGLPTSDIFFFGNKVGDSFTSTPATVFQTTSTDAIQVFASITGGAAVDNLRDYNRSGDVTSTDAVIVFANIGTLSKIEIGALGPFAPEAATDGSASAVASALAVPGSKAEANPGGNSVRSAQSEPNTGPIDRVFAQLAEGDDPRGRLELSEDEVDDVVGLDDELLDVLMVGKGANG